MRFYWERVEASRNFANKVWNASRFIMMNLEGVELREPKLDELHAADKWILSRVNTLAKDATENMDKFEPVSYTHLIQRRYLHLKRQKICRVEMQQRLHLSRLINRSLRNFRACRSLE